MQHEGDLRNLLLGNFMHYAKVSIIILNWNGKRDTLECLDSVRRIDYPHFDIIVVDNGSTDDSVSAIRKAFPDVVLLETGKNLGFAGGNNAGIRYALKQGADYLFLLNNDTIVDQQILGCFMDASVRIGQEAILGAKIYYHAEPDRIWYAGARWLEDISRFDHLGQGCIDDGKDFNTLSETDYVCGCALFVSARLLNRVGLLDEEFYLTFEETDLCYRARKAGYKSYFVPKAKVWHKISVSFGGEGSALFHYFLMRNRLLWAKKNLSISERLIIYRRVSYELLRYLLPPRFRVDDPGEESLMKSMFSSFKAYKEKYRQKQDSPLRKAKLWAVRDYLLHRFGDCPEAVRTLGKEPVKGPLR